MPKGGSSQSHGVCRRLCPGVPPRDPKGFSAEMTGEELKAAGFSRADGEWGFCLPIRRINKEPHKTLPGDPSNLIHHSLLCSVCSSHILPCCSSNSASKSQGLCTCCLPSLPISVPTPLLHLLLTCHLLREALSNFSF